MNSDITIIIPTYNNRHNYLERILDYFSSFSFEIIVVDASENSFKLTEKYKFNYLHFPGLDYTKKIHLALQQVESKYVLLCGDDDFIIPRSIDKCFVFLEENPNYSSAQGNIVAFYDKFPVKPFPFMYQMHGIDIKNEIPSERIKEFYRQHCYVHYAVHRSENLIETFKIAQEFKEKFAPYATEHLLNIISLIKGGHRVLPIFYSACESTNISSRHIYKPVHLLLKEEEYNWDYGHLVHSISLALSEKQKISYEESRLFILDLFEHLFVKPFEKTSAEPPDPLLKKYPIFQKLINKIYFIDSVKSFYNKTNYKILKYQDKRTTKLLIQKAKLLEGYPFHDTDSMKDWRKIKVIIEKYGWINN